MRRDNVNYVLVGVAVLTALGLLFATLLTITGRGGDSVDYHTEFANVAGLGAGAPVFYEGFRIGQVTAIEPQRVEGRTRYRVTLAIREDWQIPADSIAQRQASGLLADMTVGIREGRSASMLEPGAAIASIESGDVFSAMNELATELTMLSRDRLRPLVDTLATRIDSIACWPRRSACSSASTPPPTTPTACSTPPTSRRSPTSSATPARWRPS
jgi:phospholipid/cholesterol/gamma-HCH transport system substrate-binding protein